MYSYFVPEVCASSPWFICSSLLVPLPVVWFSWVFVYYDSVSSGVKWTAIFCRAMSCSATWKDDKLVCSGGQEKKSDNKIHAHTRKRAEIQALSYWSFPVKLGWWGQPSSYSLPLTDRLITAELVETLAWKSSQPTPSSPLSLSSRCLSNTDATVHSNHWFLRGQHPLIHFWVAERHLGAWWKAYFRSNNNVPSGQIFCLL